MQPKRPPQLVLVDIPDEVATPLADALDKTRDRSLETQREVGEGEGRRVRKGSRHVCSVCSTANYSL